MDWIKTTDRLPELVDKSFDACYEAFEHSDLVLVKVNGKTMTRYYCGDDGWSINEVDKPYWLPKDGVTEWAPLLEPRKEENNDN